MKSCFFNGRSEFSRWNHRFERWKNPKSLVRPKNDFKSKKKFFFADQNRLKNTCLRGFFLICAHYTPLSLLLWILICLRFFFIISLYSQNFYEAILTQKMTRDVDFFSPTKFGLRTHASVDSFWYVTIVPPFSPLITLKFRTSFYFIPGLGFL